jgi:hypothetical protein
MLKTNQKLEELSLIQDGIGDDAVIEIADALLQNAESSLE